MKYEVHYFEKVQCGSWMFAPMTGWIAKDVFGNTLAHAHTKKECIKEARERGYSVPSWAITAK